MKCEKCNAREATVLFKQTINGVTTTAHLCHECAATYQQEGGFSGAFPFGGNLFEGLFGIPSPDKSTQKTCPQCGASWAQIRRGGKPHCPGCYEAFANELEPTIRSLYGSAVHTGRSPARCREKREKQNRALTLRSKLQEAIAAERYEEAAQLRDEIKALEKEGN